MIDKWGEPILASSLEAVQMFNSGVEALATLDGSALVFAEQATEADAEFILAGCLGALVKLYPMTGQSRRDAQAILTPLADNKEEWDFREQGHFEAASAWAKGDLSGAIESFEKVLLLHPRDLLAAKVVQDLYLFNGDAVNLRDCVNRILFSWPVELPGYSDIIGMRSFGLEENFSFKEAEALGRQSLSLNPRNVYARHSVTHVFEMLGNRKDGIDYLLNSRDNWQESSSNIHMWWHLALMYIDEADARSAFKIYDDLLCGSRPVIMHDVGDRASLLWRLFLLGEDVSVRGEQLSRDAQPYIGDSVNVFNEFHLVMSEILGGRVSSAQRVLGWMKERSSRDYDSVLITGVGLPFCEGLIAFANREFEYASQAISGIRYRAHELGGSHAQQDVLAQTALVAASAAGNESLTRALSAERILARPNSQRATERLVVAGKDWGTER